MNIPFLNSNLNLFNINNKIHNNKSNFSEKRVSLNKDNSSNPFAFYHNALKNYNISFTSSLAKNKLEPVYAMDAYDNAVKFDSLDIAAEAFTFSRKDILKCVKGIKDEVNGIVFAYAENCEIKTSNSTMLDSVMVYLAKEILTYDSKKAKNLPKIPELLADKMPDVYSDEPSKPQKAFDKSPLDKQKVNKPEVKTAVKISSESIEDKKQEDEEEFKGVDSLPDEDITNARKMDLRNPYYVMDSKRKYRKFYRQVHLANALSVSQSAISACLRNDIKLIKGFALQYAKEVEGKDENGNIVLNLENLKSKFARKNEGFYIVDKTGKHNKFYEPAEVEKLYDIPCASVLRCLMGKQDCYGEYIFFKAHDLEKIKRNGKIEINKKLIDEKRANILKKAVCLIKNEDEYDIYDNQTKAADAISVDPAMVSRSVLHNKIVRGCCVARANEVARYDKNGKLKFNKEKIKQIYQASQNHEKIKIPPEGFLAINKEREIKRFYMLIDAEKKLGADSDGISLCLKNKASTAGGYIYCFPSEIEFIDENHVNKVKLAEKMRLFKIKSLYSINKNGVCTFFDNQKDASDELSVPFKAVSACVTGNKRSASDYAFVAANDIEIITPEGEIELNQKIIKENVEYLNRKENDALYAVDCYGEYKRYDTRGEFLAKYPKIDKANLSACLKGKGNTIGGFACILANKVETKLEDGTIDVDEEALKALKYKFKRKKTESEKSNNN